MTPDELRALSDRLTAEAETIKKQIVGGTREQWHAVGDIEHAARLLWSAHAWLARHQENTGEALVATVIEVPLGSRLVDMDLVEVDPVDLSEPGADPGPHAEWTVYCPRGCDFGAEAVQPSAAAAVDAATRHRVATGGHEAHVIVG